MGEQLPLAAETVEAVPVAQSEQADPMLAAFERIVLNPEIPAERVDMMFNLMERQRDKEAEQAFNAAFASAMAEMPDVPKSGKNNHTKNTYSTLDDLIRTARPVLARHGLSLAWEAGEDDSRIWVKAIVRHALGHQITTRQSGPRDTGKAMNVLQGGGSTETYLKRYTGFAILGLSSGDEADDDGQGAGGTITAEQFQELRVKIEETGADEARFLKYLNVEHLEELPMHDFGKATAALNSKAAKNA